MNVEEDSRSDYSSGSDSSAGSSKSNLIERGDFARNLLHLQLLLQKTFWQFARNKKNILVCLFCPIVFNLVCYYLNSMEPMMAESRPVTGAHHELDPVSKCFGNNCVTIGYSILGDPVMSKQYSWIDDIME